MAPKRFTAEQIIMKLREAEVGLARGKSVRQVCKQIGVSLHPICQEEPYNPGRNVSINPNKDSILTPQRPVPDARLGYALTRRLPRVYIFSEGETYTPVML